VGENSLCKYASQPEVVKNSLKTRIFRVQGRIRSSMFVPPESSSAVLVMISGKSVSICNLSRARLKYKLALLKYTFNAENFMHRLSWSISNDFGLIHSRNFKMYVAA